jgi:hypothetical protein
MSAKETCPNCGKSTDNQLNGFAEIVNEWGTNWRVTISWQRYEAAFGQDWVCSSCVLEFANHLARVLMYREGEGRK